VLLLDTQARRLAAQVGEGQPFGVPGARAGRRSDLHRGFSVTAGALLAVLGGFALYTVRHELVLLLVAAFIAIGLDPAVRWLVRCGLSRPLAVAVIALGLFAGFAAAAFPPLAREASELARNGPRYARELQDQHNTLGRLNAKYHVTERIQQSLQNGLSIKTAGGLLSAGTAVLSFTFELVVTLVLVVYFLADLPRIKQVLYRLVALRHRPRFGLLADEVIFRVGGYVLGNVATSVVAIVTSYLLLLILGVPYALVLSVLTGILDLIPLVGSSIAGVVVALVALAAVSPAAALVTVVFHRPRYRPPRNSWRVGRSRWRQHSRLRSPSRVFEPDPKGAGLRRRTSRRPGRGRAYCAGSRTGRTPGRRARTRPRSGSR